MKSSNNAANNNRSLSILILSLLLVLSVIDLWCIQFLRMEGRLLRFQQVDSEKFDGFFRQAGEGPENTAFFHSKLVGAGIEKCQGDRDKILFIQKWLMNDMKKSGPYYSESPIEVFERGERGEGLSCESMCQVFVAALRSYGFKARKIQLVRSLLNERDTHVTTEVLVEGRWVIFDPTFNVSYRKEGRLINAEEMRSSLLDGSFGKIHPVYYGPVAYPARLDKYYLNWISPYNNLFIFQKETNGFWTKVPPLRYWLGPRFCYLETYSSGLWHFQSANRDYFISSVILPAVNFSLLLVFVFIRFRSKESLF